MIGNKFKVGDIVYHNDESDYKFLVLKIAQIGEIVQGKWFDGSSEKEIPRECYIVESLRSSVLYLLGFDFEDFYEAVKELNEKDYDFKTKYPNVCPYCKKPAYIGGLNNVECSNPKCFFYDG